MPADVRGILCLAVKTLGGRVNPLVCRNVFWYARKSVGKAILSETCRDSVSSGPRVKPAMQSPQGELHVQMVYTALQMILRVQVICTEIKIVTKYCHNERGSILCTL
jgi:hypothetical protein